MSRRLVEHYLLKIKLQSIRLPEDQVNDINIFQELIKGVLRPSANRMLGEQSGAKLTRVLSKAAAIATDRTKQGSLYQLSETSEQKLLLESLRSDIPIETAAGQRLLPGLMVFGWPDWLIALFDLLCLSQPTWAYIRLGTTQSQGPNWEDRLSAILWKESSANSLLRGCHSTLMQLAQELEIAYDAILQDRQLDPIDQFLQQIQKENATQAFQPGNGRSVSEWLEIFPDSNSNSSPISSLRGLSFQGIKRLKGHAQNDHLDNAWQELRTETTTGNLTSRQHLFLFLDTLQHGIGQLNSVGDVLATLKNPPPSSISSTAVCEEIVTRQELVHFLRGTFPQNHVTRVVLLGLLQNKSFIDIRQDLGDLLPEYSLDRCTMLRMCEMLKEWHEYIEALSPKNPTPGFRNWGDLYMDIPMDVVNCDKLTTSIAFLTKQLNKEVLSWQEVSADIEPLLRDAVRFISMDLLIEGMQDCYRKHHEKIAS